MEICPKREEGCLQYSSGPLEIYPKREEGGLQYSSGPLESCPKREEGCVKDDINPRCIPIYDVKSSSISSGGNFVYPPGCNVDFTSSYLAWGSAHIRRCKICKGCDFQQNWDALLDTHFAVYNSGVSNYRGCRIPVPSKLNIEFLKDVLCDYWDKELVQFLEYGFPVGMVIERKEFVRNKFPRNHLGANEFPDQMHSYLASEQCKGRILGPFKAINFGHCVAFSPLNSVPKRDSEERRVILDLSWPNLYSVNDYIYKDWYCGEKVGLSYPTIDSLVELIGKKGRNCLLFKKDLKAAYRQLPIDPGDWMFLGYCWKGHIFLDCVLAMGLRSACNCCQRTTTAIKYLFSKEGFELVNYIDDLAGAECSDVAQQAYCCLMNILVNCGLQESVIKSCAPSTIMVFLGVLLNTETLTLEITPDRLKDILEILLEWEDKISAKKRDVQSLIGKLVFIGACVKPGRIFLSRMLNFLRSMSDVDEVVLPYEFIKDVLWWKEFAPLFNGTAKMFMDISLHPDCWVSSDACLSGCGGLSQDEYFHVQFPPFILQRNIHINGLELMTIAVCCKLWGRLWTGKRIDINCDNMASVIVLNSGKARDPFLQKCLREIAYLCAVNKFEIRAFHIAGIDNREADCLSRWHLNDSYGQEFVQSVDKSYREVHVESLSFKFMHNW